MTIKELIEELRAYINESTGQVTEDSKVMVTGLDRYGEVSYDREVSIIIVKGYKSVMPYPIKLI